MKQQILHLIITNRIQQKNHTQAERYKAILLTYFKGSEIFFEHYHWIFEVI